MQTIFATLAMYIFILFTIKSILLPSPSALFYKLYLLKLLYHSHILLLLFIFPLCEALQPSSLYCLLELQDSWEGPFVVTRKLSAVNYIIEEEEGRKRSKVVHVNNLKSFKERELEVCALTVLAEEKELQDTSSVLHVEECEGYKDKDIGKILAEFKDAMSETPGKTEVVKMSVEVEKSTRVISQMPYRLPDRLKEAVRSELDDLAKADIIEPSDSHWASPLVPVVKPDGKVRLCVDFRRLNTVTPQQQSYIPCLDDILGRVGQSRVLSKLDLSKGFHQVLMSEESKDLTTFVCPFGKYRFRRMPFGLKNAPAVFQLLMEQVLVSCKDFSPVYIYDIIIFSSCWDEHIEHVRKVLSALRVTGLTAKPSKCQWGRRHLDYLGHRVGCGKVAVPEHRVVAMAEYRQPVPGSI